MKQIDSTTLKELAAYSGDPWTPANPYFNDAEPAMDSLWDGYVWPVIRDCDFSSCVDLAAGHGRNSRKLLDLCGTLAITDIQTENIDHCRKRFATRTNVSYFVGNGYDFAPMTDSSASFIYCFDAMVHFDSDVVRSYLRDTLRVLKPGGSAFYHHSNLTTSSDWRANIGARNFMTADLFKHYAKKEGLHVARQCVIDWAGVQNSDCLSLVQRPI